MPDLGRSEHSERDLALIFGRLTDDELRELGRVLRDVSDRSELLANLYYGARAAQMKRASHA